MSANRLLMVAHGLSRTVHVQGNYVQIRQTDINQFQKSYRFAQTLRDLKLYDHEVTSFKMTLFSDNFEI